MRIAPRKHQVLRRDNDVERLQEKKVAQEVGGRQFQNEGPMTVKDLD